MTRYASLSLDLDNLWSYMKTHGDEGWQSFPSYFDKVVPRFLEVLDQADVKITVFVVGQDAALEENHAALRSIVEAGHEIGNHSFHHEPWLHLYSPEELSTELGRAEDAIQSATGVKPQGFRGPGYSLSEEVLRELNRRGYAYDCSTFPTVIGPLARAYYFAKARLGAAQKEKRKSLFGGMSDGFRPLKEYRWDLGNAHMLEIPVTTMPFSRVPIHFSYLQWLAGMSDRLASTYFATGLRMCRLGGVTPSMLLHPLDFIGGDDVSELSFFPAMNQSSADKMRRMQHYVKMLTDAYETVPMGVHADRLKQAALPLRKPDFPDVEELPTSAQEKAEVQQ